MASANTGHIRISVPHLQCNNLHPLAAYRCSNPRCSAAITACHCLDIFCTVQQQNPPTQPFLSLQRPPKATPKPYTRHILGIDLGVQSHLKATLMRPSCDPHATLMRPSSHPKATLKPIQRPVYP